MRRIEPRWRTRFGRWLAGYTVPRLAKDLSRRNLPTTTNAVYQWVRGATLPDVRRALALEQLSAGSVGLRELCSHQSAVRRQGPSPVRHPTAAP